MTETYDKENHREPKVPREWWVNLDDDGDMQVHPSRERADYKKYLNRIECVHVREVLPEGDA